MNNIKEIKIELTNECYHNCIHCSSEASAKEVKELDVEIVKRIIDEAVELKVESVVFTGGEATLYIYLKDLIEYAKERNLKVKLYTMCEPSPTNIYILHRLDELGLDEIIYSLAYQLTTDNSVNPHNIKKFIDEILAITNFKIGFHYVLTKQTLNDLEEIVKLENSFDSPKIDKLSLLRYVPHGRGDRSLEVSVSEINNALKDIYSQNEALIRLGSPFNILNLTHHACTTASETVIVGVNGNVYPCDAMKYFDYLGIGGNIYKHSLQEIINSNYFKDIRNFRCHVNEECLKCKNFALCKGGCLGQKLINNFNNDGDITTEWYELNAKRTMNNFKTTNDMKFNYKMGIIGETGELFDSLKKYYTHDLTNEKKEELKKIMIGEIGDIIWYISASLATYHKFSVDDVVAKIMHCNKNAKLKLDSKIIEKASELKDPLCPYLDVASFKISDIDTKIITNNYNIYNDVDDYIHLIANLVTSNNREEVIELSAKLLLFLGRIANCELNVSLEEVMKQNIKKLQERYPNGFDKEVSNGRINYTKKYKLNEPKGI